MTNFARIIDHIAVDVSSDPQAHFHPQLASEFVAVPDQVSRGWRCDAEGHWQAPASMPVQAESQPAEAS
ncbi:hypothetical protein [Rivihabitans pingtungensis]|uniref:hypothetical protein n=1 Tax=Rivihabitans pingtungensis TaxID=1054498 RepID=UPI002355FC17|nr:hypothetical protein [Rivihabitans pingtungensis]MCK6437762.1 hypothetical protein [Rivihabitans pingtungensis]